MQAPHQDRSQTAQTLPALALAALGVVYGDIGTSPLYAIKECFHGMHAIALTQANILGVLSLVFWSLTIVVTVKYVFFILKADNKGEGGIFALLELLPKTKTLSPKLHGTLVFLALFGAALLYGDGVITPAISVLSAMEGLEVATTAAKPAVVPLTCIVLFLLFCIQRYGTAGIGKIFGQVMLVWFLGIGFLGLREIVAAPAVLDALNPMHALRFFAVNKLHGMVVLGSVVLCITGGEALYADMGHFGRRAIQISWMALAFPTLLLNYFGQGAALLARPEIVANPFYGLVPKALLYPMVGLSTMATVIASQAMISGVFSLTRQAIQLGYFPRMRIIHTSSGMEGQIYIPEVNKALMLACIGLVLVFKESTNLAAAYGIAVTATMAITSLLYYFVARHTWGWSLWKAAPLAGLFLFFDVTYFGANLLKVLDGGWFTLAIAALVVLSMSTWKEGRRILSDRLQSAMIPFRDFVKDVKRKQPVRVAGAAVFLTLSPRGTPVTLLHFFKHTKVLHEKVALLSVTASDVPYVPDENKVAVTCLGEEFYRIIAKYGFMESPNAMDILAKAADLGFEPNLNDTTFFLGRESLMTSGPSTMSGWRKNLFAVMSRNARPASYYFHIPPGRVMELGMQVDM